MRHLSNKDAKDLANATNPAALCQGGCGDRADGRIPPSPAHTTLIVAPGHNINRKLKAPKSMQNETE